ncbi:MAG: formylmethanofuran--tetrahydromethanopterin N-formyltransferase [Planctomycetales bacterium]|nr:formylmethanofuran--tetrahydromethanopterin N-formyltransferase [Planctomycetales bacterium]
MQIGPTHILDTYAEAFRMRYTRLLVTAADAHWLHAGLQALCGYGCSVIGCDAEIAVEQMLPEGDSPDGRPAAAVMAFGFSTAALAKALPNRVGQCVMTCPTTAAYDGLTAAEERVPLGDRLRFFGDGFQKSKQLGARRCWRVPVMDGEFLCEDSMGVAKGVAGGNIILQGATQACALEAARRVSQALKDLPGVITPFPGGVVRSGSKVGSRYKQLVASTNHAHCPTLRGRVESELLPGAQAAYEVVFNGQDEQTVANATTCALHAAPGDGILAIGAGNYGGKLGKFHFHLRKLV